MNSSIGDMARSPVKFPHRFDFFEFFAGGGMARLGLGSNWNCVFANDFDPKKEVCYRANFNNAPEFLSGDIRGISAAQLPGKAMLAWASFPCQDLSLAGNGAGLSGKRSGIFWSFWELMLSLRDEGRIPPIIVLENVAGLITSHNGADLAALITTLVNAGYRVGAVVVDGALFVAQSRPRLFIIAVDQSIDIPEDVCSHSPHPMWHPKSLQYMVRGMQYENREAWIWWRLPIPIQQPPKFDEIIEVDPVGVEWHSPIETERLLAMMSAVNLDKVRAMHKSGLRHVGTIYKRTRDRAQRAEVRFDGISGCLRTPAGGSSRQIIIFVEGDIIRSRLISPRETARLMGLPESYTLPSRYNDAYHLTGDGVVVPAVSWIEINILRPLANSNKSYAERGFPLEKKLA